MNKVFVMGDIHGKFQPIRNFHLRHNTNKEYNKAEKTLILLGDAGLNFFFDDRDTKVKEKLGKFPFTYFVIRGNHEERPSILSGKNPDKWHLEKYFNGDVWVENDYPYIKYAMDHVSFYNISTEEYNYKTLVIPGAYSVDKYYRISLGRTWFPQEQLSKEEMEHGLKLIKSENYKCDLVLSHTCPIIYEPTDLFLSTIDQSMVEKDMERYLGEIEYKLNYKAWLWGHYHQFRDYPRVDRKIRTMLFNDAAIDLDIHMKEEIVKL